jgi:nucleotide-binding universal stress UspA family protein
MAISEAVRMNAQLAHETKIGSSSPTRLRGGVMTKTLLVPLDGSDDAMRSLPIAARIADAVDANVVLVAAELPGFAERPSASWLEGVGATVGPHGARTEIVASVEVSDALGALAAAELDPVVCMATHARAPVGRAWFGSVAEAVLRELAYPVVLVGPRCDTRWRPGGPIIAALDGSTAALDALGAAIDWDRELGAGITLVHVAHPLDTDLVPDAVLEAATKRFPDIDLRTCVLRSREPEWEVVDYARRHGASLVACSTHGRRGVARALIGSVAMGIVRRAACPVLVQRPLRSSQSAVSPKARTEEEVSS